MEHDSRSKQVLLCCVVAVCVWALFCVVLWAVCARCTMCSADNNGDHKGCKALVDTLQTHIMACSNALPLCLAYVCSGREA